MIPYDVLETLKSQMGTSAYADRIVSELHFACNLSLALDGKYDDAVTAAIRALDASVREERVITKTAALAVEKMLLPLQADAKKYRIHCVAHAHIDMNWMWGFQETVSVTVDTFRTVLNLMKEYPTLTFAQSQASTYEIIEKYAPSMLPEIRERVKEGRWEVSASTWVETDKNMPSGESLARHILYTKRYLSKLLDIPAESLALDFEPDTFGHNVSVPEICAAGGVKYYYHCRGNAGDRHAYVWRGRAGSELLCYREPYWYNADIEPDMLWDIPMQCKQQGIGCMLKVYGVGDHGGGPTRRDVERLIEMASWPIMPTILFSTYKAFYAELEQFRGNLTVLEGEQNFLFNGCYTSQSRIKLANRIAEDRIYESEALDTEAMLAGGEHFADCFREAWKNILFNQFHDILPGSGVVDTREYAMGRFQDAMAHIGTSANLAMRAIARQIDTTGIELKDDPESRSAGAGAGYGVEHKKHYGMPVAERGMGKTRLFHLFNSTQYDYDGVVELTVWDWNYDPARAVFTDTKGQKSDFKLIEEGKKAYWGHKYKIFALCVKVPAFGYASYTLDEAVVAADISTKPPHQRVIIDTDDDLVLENNLVRAVFNHTTMQMVSLVDKKTGDELMAAPACTFRLITENNRRGMTAWYVGEYAKIKNLNETQGVRVKAIENEGVRQWIDFEMSFAERSKLSARVLLDENSPTVQFDVTVDFHEIGNKEKGIPQLNFSVPYAYESKECRFDVPFGTLDRAPLNYDVPANSFAVPLNKNGSSLMLVSDSKYGFRYTEDGVTLSLIRASFDPDPYPEYGVHRFRLGVSACADVAPDALYRTASAFVHPVSYCTADLHERGGALSLDGRFLTVTGDVRMTALKTAENGRDVVVRLHNNGGKQTDFTLTLAKDVAFAHDVDLNENIIGDLALEGNTVKSACAPYAIRTVLLKLK